MILAFGFLYGIAAAAPVENIESILRGSAAQKAKFSVYAVNASDGKPLYSYRSSAAMMPASNMKLVTTAAAVHYLGADYVFRTEIGLLNDNLVSLVRAIHCWEIPRLTSNMAVSPAGYWTQSYRY
jgi:D-alanyl-D-alanine carboxypeptidase